jgi:hypothetical protein
MANRLVIKYLEIDENNKVVNEWQERILDAQEPHLHHNHHTKPHCNPIPDPIPTPIDVVQTDLVIDLQIDDTKDYTGYDRMARVSLIEDGGFDGNAFIVGDGGWYKSGKRIFQPNLALNEKYFIRLATTINPLSLLNNQGTFNQVVTLLENDVDKTTDWKIANAGNNQLMVFTKQFSYNGTYPKITFKIDLT